MKKISLILLVTFIVGYPASLFAKGQSLYGVFVRDYVTMGLCYTEKNDDARWRNSFRNMLVEKEQMLPSVRIFADSARKEVDTDGCLDTGTLYMYKPNTDLGGTPGKYAIVLAAQIETEEGFFTKHRTVYGATGFCVYDKNLDVKLLRSETSVGNIVEQDDVPSYLSNLVNSVQNEFKGFCNGQLHVMYEKVEL